ncbi:MaoC family dehydratase N-terminal domain-containing protein [Planktotalea sp.]|uniref:FAS1-like dehydratase domain-containing protein n=1 Tax=Planktotalea sp. TaxID=2029877 RepID=UPI0025F918F2|nr:MaoC family dehydratase N-terminal domain-containing protein [Planktotalea sp.]
MIDIDHLRTWETRTEDRDDLIATFPSNALAASLDRDDPLYEIGDPLPPLWHWLHFLPIHKLQDSGYDGHAALGTFLPPVPLPRRMWAGSRLTFHAPMKIGQHLTKRSTIKSVSHKSGRSGDLVFVTVQHDVYDRDAQCLSEEHDIVYRAAAAKDAPPLVPTQAPVHSDFSRKIEPDPILLFRYSALTFNGHRIHYDHPFCIETEGYDGLVVHGPLLATLMLDLLRREMPDAHVSAFEFRAHASIFDTHNFSIHGQPNPDDTIHLWIQRHDGALAMDGKATLGPNP